MNETSILEAFTQFKTTILEQLDKFDAKIENLVMSLSEIKLRADAAFDIAESAKEKSEANDKEIKVLIERNLDYENRIKILEDDLDDQINRSMRETVVFKNIPGSESSWEETAKVLCRCINECDGNIPEGEAWDMIERAHRVKSKVEHKGPDIIVAKFIDWKSSELIKDIFTKRNTKMGKRGINITAEPLQSKKLLARSNAAKKFWKEQKLLNPNWKMFVAHPAKLLLKRPGENSYKVFREF